MADFWGGFGKGFAPAFEKSWESAARKQEKREDRAYAEAQLQKQLARAKDERVRKEFQTIRGFENLGVSSGVRESQDPSTQGPLRRAGVTDELDYLPASEREALAFSLPYKYEAEKAGRKRDQDRADLWEGRDYAAYLDQFKYSRTKKDKLEAENSLLNEESSESQ